MEGFLAKKFVILKEFKFGWRIIITTMKGAKELATPFGKNNGQIRACSLFCISNSLHGLSEKE